MSIAGRALPVVAAVAAALAIAGCAQETVVTTNVSANVAGADNVAAAPPAEVPPAAALSANLSTNAAAPRPEADLVLRPGGLGVLRIGEPIPSGSGWAERGAQASDTCRLISSPDHPGVYAIVEDGRVRRITIGQRSALQVAAGIGIGASERAVRDAFPGLEEEAHKYVAAPGKYLTSPDAGRGVPALRFEIGADGRVSLIHAGVEPVLSYVEACS